MRPTTDLANPSPATTGRSHNRASRATASAWACLVVAEDMTRRQRFALAAEEAGWNAIECGSIGEAIRVTDRWRTQLAVIDLGDMQAAQKSSYMQFAARVASHDRLLLVSDEPVSHEAEVWARQVGAWLYLASPDFESGLPDLFAEARGAVEKLVVPTVTPAEEVT